MAQLEPMPALDLPSSPPLLPEHSFWSEPPSSPLPSHSSTLPVALPTRKRQLAECQYSLSSDPLFSEDPSEIEDVINYDRPRRKRLVKGPWWKVRDRQTAWDEERRAKDSALTKRNFDSGIFMGSDASDDSIENSLRTSQHRAQVTQDDRHMQAAVSGEALAEQIVSGTLDTAKESVDLSNLHLSQLSSATLKPLHQLIRQSHNHVTKPPSEDEFTTLTPDVKLFLAGNSLTSLPDELFLLSNITVLSLRNNELAELPPSIARLRRLEELNIAGNSIQFLPWELLPYFRSTDGKRKRITVRPNPLFQPVEMNGPLQQTSQVQRFLDVSTHVETCLQGVRQQCTAQEPLNARSELELRLQIGRWRERRCRETESRRHAGVDDPCEQLLYLASSKIHFLDVDGRPDQPGWTPAVVLDEPRRGPVSSCAPSLFELATRSVQQHYHLDSIPETMPVPVQAALRNASSARRLGNRKCSNCERPYVTPRAQWIEYWFCGMSSQAHLTQETVLPFQRLACSWGCAEGGRLE